MTEVSTDDLDAFNNIDETVFVAHISPDDHAAREIFAGIARKYRGEFTFGLMLDGDLVNEQGSATPMVTCNLKDGGSVKKMSASLTDSAALENFVIEASRPVVGELTKYNQQRLLNVSVDHSPLSPQAYSGPKSHVLTEYLISVDGL